MWKIIPYAILQSLLLAGGQVFLKFALLRMPPFSWTRTFWTALLVNWQFAACGLLFGLSSLLWMYIVKVFPFSVAYPMISLSYVFGMLAAIVFFHEDVSVGKWVGVLFIMIGCTLTATAQPLDQAQVKQQIGRAASALNSMQCDFVQTKHLKILNEDMVSKGKMYYQQPDHLRWEYTTPYSYTFILNGSKVLLKNNKRNDVIDVNQNKLFKEIARIMMNTVVGTCLSDDKDFSVSIADSQTEWVATLRPVRKDMKQLFQKIVLHFNKDRKMVARVELIEKKGDKTLIELKNIRSNAPVQKSLFSVN